VLKAVVSVPTNHEERSNPFATAKAAAEAAMDRSPFELAAVQESALGIRTPSPVMQQQQKRKVSFSKKLLSCACVRPSVAEATSGFDIVDDSLATSSNTSSLSDVQRNKGVHWQDISPRKSMTLMKQSSAAYTDVDW